MLVAAAVCPHPPALVPEATGAAGASENDAAELRQLRTTCDDAVGTLLATRPDLLAVVGSGPASATYPATAAGGLHEYGVQFTIGTGSPVLPLSLTIGKWLLARNASVPAVELHAIAAHAASDDCRALGARIVSGKPRVAMLLMGDGPGRRARQAPGAVDAEADSFDAEVTAALAHADTQRLAMLDPEVATALFAAGRPAWQALAGAAAQGGNELDARLTYSAAPFEVSYYVATWTPRRG